MNLLSFISYICVTSFTPGPNNLISMSNGIKGGVKKALPYAAGVFSGVALMSGLAAWFGALIYDTLPIVEPFMRLAGAVYILFLAFATFRDKPNTKKSYSLDTDKFAAGVLLQFINVKAYLYCITTMSTFVLPYYRGIALLGFVTLLAAVAFMSNILWAVFGSVFDRFFKSHRKTLNFIMALLLIYCAITMIWR